MRPLKQRGTLKTPAESGSFVPISAYGQNQLETQRAAALRPWFAALANRSYGPANVLFLGDSTIEGRGGTGITRRWQTLARDALRLRFPVAGVTGGDNYLAAEYESPTLTSPARGGTTGVSYQFGVGNRSVYLGAAGTLTFSNVVGTSFKVMTAGTSSSGSFTVSVDGGASLGTVTTAIASLTDGQMSASFALTAGTHTVTLTKASGGNAYVDGLVVYNGDETVGIRCWDGGHNGYKASDLDVTSQATQRYAVVDPRLVVIGVGPNDYNANVSSATFKTQLQAVIALITAASTGTPSYVLYAHVQRSDTASPAEPWANYVQAMYDVAAAATNVVVFDLNLRLPTIAAETTSLWLDSVHANDRGQSLIADAFVQFITPR